MVAVCQPYNTRILYCIVRADLTHRRAD